MEKILEMLSQALQEARSLIAEEKAKITVLDDRKAMFEAEKADHEKKVINISAREAAITPIENLNSYTKELDAKASKVETGLSDLAEKKQQFETYRSATQQKLDAQAEEQSAQSKELDRRKAQMETEVKTKVQAVVSKLKG